jgi:hypothetical protein
MEKAVDIVVRTLIRRGTAESSRASAFRLAPRGEPRSISMASLILEVSYAAVWHVWSPSLWAVGET